MTKERLQQELDRMSEGKYSGFTIGQLCDKISWMWKWKKISYEEMEMMSLQAINIIGNGGYNGYR